MKKSRHRHPKLNALHQHMKGNTNHCVDFRVDLGILVQISNTEEDCKRIYDVLTKCNAALHAIFLRENLRSPTQNIVYPNWTVRNLAEGLHTALKAQWPNCESAPHEAKLRLATHQSSKYMNRRVNFDMLMTTHSSRWQEGSFLVTDIGRVAFPLRLHRR